MSKLKKVPKFKNEDEEARFWNRVDSTDYVNWSKAKHWIFPNLKMTSKPITMRIQESVLDQVKARANKFDMPYQTLIKQFIFKGLGLTP